MIEIKTISSENEIKNRKELFKLYTESPIPDDEIIQNVGLFLKRQELSKILFLNHLYQKFIDTHGIMIEFGVRWGQNLSILNNLRGIYEPYNFSRRLIGFDTFSGFKNISNLDGTHKIIKEGSFSVTENYENYLNEILEKHEKECPMSHVKKNFIFKGDAVIEFEKYLKNQPETLVSFAYFDFDIYQPTKKCLELLIPVMNKGGIIAFDEILDPNFPGETIAYKEILKEKNLKIHKNPFGGIQSYIII
jgi:hypothetical protein